MGATPIASSFSLLLYQQNPHAHLAHQKAYKCQIHAIPASPAVSRGHRSGSLLDRSCFSFVCPIIFKLGDCPPQTFLDQFHIIVHPSPLHLILENRIPEYFFFGESDSNKIAVSEMYLQCPPVLFQSFCLPFG